MQAKRFDLEHETLLVHFNAVVEVSLNLSDDCDVPAYLCSDQIINSLRLVRFTSDSLNLKQTLLEVVKCPV